jgi:hypothetical protein
MKRRAFVTGLREVLLKRLLNDLFQPFRQLTTEQLSKERDVTYGVDRLRIDPHLHPKPDALKLYPLAVWSPLSPAYQGAELTRHTIDSCLEAATRIVERAAVLDSQVEQRHWVLPVAVSSPTC